MFLGCSVAQRLAPVFFPPQVTMLMFKRRVVSNILGSKLIKSYPLWWFCSSHLVISFGKSFIACVLTLHGQHQGLLGSR